MNNAVFGKTMENVRNIEHGDIKLVTTERRRNYLVSEHSWTPPSPLYKGGGLSF